MSSNIWLTADTHFGHALAAKIRGFDSIEEHDEFIISAHNALVKPKDIVWHLGDVSMAKRHIKTIDRMHGQKRLVLGNHDNYRIQEYLPYFDKIFGCVRFKEMILTHIPIREDCIEFRFKANIYGHLHERDDPFKDDPRYLCVSLDRTGFMPVNMSTIIKI